MTLAGALLGLVVATGLGILLLAHTEPPEHIIGALAFALLLAMPGVLAVLSLWSRPVLLVPAAVLSFLLSFVSLAGATLVLLVPALCYASAYYLRPWYPRALTRSLLAVALPVLGGVGAFAVAVIGVGPADPMCWAFREDARGDRTYRRVDCQEAKRVEPRVVDPPAGSGGSGSASGTASSGGSGSSYSSDVVTPVESAAGVVLVAAGLGAGWVLAAPQDAQAVRRRPLAPRLPTPPSPPPN